MNMKKLCDIVVRYPGISVGVCGLALGLLIALFMTIAQLRAIDRASTTAREVAAVAAVANSVYTAMPNYSGLTSSVLAHSDMLPPEMVTADNRLITPYGTVITVSPTTVASRNDAVMIQTVMSSMACTMLADSTLGDLMTVNGGRAKTPAAAKAYCGDMAGLGRVAFVTSSKTRK